MAYFQQIQFTDADVVEPDNWIPAGESNPHKVRPWLLHDHGFALAVVFASSLQDALDEAVDADKLDAFRLDAEQMAEYEADGLEPAYLGNASEPFDIDALGYVELPNPKASFCQQFSAQFEK